jgi:indolepyruvate decarboxylase
MDPAAELEVHGAGSFICNSVWQAIGFSVGATVGVALASDRRPIAICGDGGFQMTAQSLSTIAKRKLPAIVVVLDNSEYGIEQWLLEPKYFADTNAQPRPYLSLNRWDYAGLARAVGIANAVTAKSAAELTKALATAKASDAPAFICASVKPHDLPSQLRSA